jgi:hypothetical protein
MTVVINALVICRIRILIIIDVVSGNSCDERIVAIIVEPSVMPKWARDSWSPWRNVFSYSSVTSLFGRTEHSDYAD